MVHPTSLTTEYLEKGDDFVIHDAPFHRISAGSGPRKKEQRRFTWHAFSFSERLRSEEQAYDSVEELYAFLKEQGCIPIKTLKKMYDSDDIEIIFKKGLITELAEYFQIANSVRLIKKKEQGLKKQQRK